MERGHHVIDRSLDHFYSNTFFLTVLEKIFKKSPTEKFFYQFSSNFRNFIDVSNFRRIFTDFSNFRRIFTDFSNFQIFVDFSPIFQIFVEVSPIFQIFVEFFNFHRFSSNFRIVTHFSNFRRILEFSPIFHIFIFRIFRFENHTLVCWSRGIRHVVLLPYIMLERSKTEILLNDVSKSWEHFYAKICHGYFMPN